MVQTKQKGAIWSWRDPMSALTHMIAFLLVLPAGAALVVQQAMRGEVVSALACTVFVFSALLLYGASTFYHMAHGTKEQIAFRRRIDHIMIFLLIAGTYTPVCLVNLSGFWGTLLLILVWALALAGLVLKIFLFGSPRLLSTTIYVVMGWLVLVAAYPLVQSVPLGGLALLAAGGVMYTLGAVIYATKSKRLSFGAFGFHEIFHLFVMAGTAFHFLYFFLYLS